MKKAYQKFDRLFGGRRWIRTTEGAADRFTVCSLWPLGNPSKSGADDWNRTRNLLITNQLLCQLSYISVLNLVPRGVIEPPTQGFSVPCSTDWATEALQVVFFENACNNYKHFHLATRKGLEPSTSSVTGWRTNHLYYRAKLFCFYWWAFTDSNRGPIGYEPTALTYWAKGPYVVKRLLVGVKRLELPTSWSQTMRATNCATPRFVTTLIYNIIKERNCQQEKGIFQKNFY